MFVGCNANDAGLAPAAAITITITITVVAVTEKCLPIHRLDG
jgi:hypothetical protein